MYQIQFIDNARQPIAINKIEFRLGRTADNDIVLDNPSVTDFHARLLIRDEAVVLVNHDSGAETYVNGNRISGETVLSVGDRLCLGSVELLLVKAEWTLKEIQSKRLFPIKGNTTVGRQPECTISLLEGGVSRLHARLFIRDGALMLEDLGSLNGTSVNGKSINEPVTLRNDDEICFDLNAFRVIYQIMGTPEGTLKNSKKVPQPAAGLNSQTSGSRLQLSESAPPSPGLKSPLSRPQEDVHAIPEKGRAVSAEPDRAPLIPQRNSGAKSENVKDPKGMSRQEIAPRKINWWMKPKSGPRSTVYMDRLSKNSMKPDLSLLPPEDLACPILVGISDEVKGRRIELLSKTLIVGRSPDSGLVINDSRVSDKHAQILVDNGTVGVVSFPNCTNGTFVNDVRAAGRIFLQSGDILRFGNVEFIFWSRVNPQSKEGRRRIYTVAALAAALLLIVALVWVFKWTG